MSKNRRRDAQRAREALAASRRRQERRRRLTVAWGAVGTVLVIIAALVLAKITMRNPAPTGGEVRPGLR